MPSSDQPGRPAGGTAPDASGMAGGPATGHEHRWAGVAFTFRDDHPWFQLRCACGAERSIRAWERYSEPDPEPPADEPMAAGEG